MSTILNWIRNLFHMVICNYNTITTLYIIHPKQKPKGISFKDIKGKKYESFGKALRWRFGFKGDLTTQSICKEVTYSIPLLQQKMLLSIECFLLEPLTWLEYGLFYSNTQFDALLRAAKKYHRSWQRKDGRAKQRWSM